jgi:hypothetical protein
MKLFKTSLIVAAVVALALPAVAQRKRVSPHETLNASIDGDKITVVYGRPYTKDPKSGEPRKVWGKLVPFGKIWRTGADEATVLTTETALAFGDTTVPAGKYSLYTLPAEDGSAKLVINKQTGQWGTQYDQAQDLARVDLKRTTLEKSVDQFTIAIDPAKGGGGVLKLSWETAEYSVPFTVKK